MQDKDLAQNNDMGIDFKSGPLSAGELFLPINTQLKQTSAEGHISYMVYASDTDYKENQKQQIRKDSNYYSTLKYRQRFTDDFDNQWFQHVFNTKPGKVRGVW